MPRATKTPSPTSADSRAPAPAAKSGSHGPRAAADRVCSRHSVTVFFGGRRVELPSEEQLCFLAGVGLLAVVGIIEWPVAAAIAIGHGLAHSQHGKALREFGEALEEA
ncbi:MULTISPECIES: hypothetical protein [Streptomyces]|uniref:Uncharacterized protein n=1 Tax=Streptomyces mordarskii TaxID=1226758 RepID=A0ABN1D855_9ACTN|nr:hypothetical protein [Streptomyces antimycoticus]WTB03314.1 hypothetical protein OG546_03170 [Streptomyces antimycoticus]